MANLLSQTTASAGALSLVANAASSLPGIIAATPQSNIGYQPENQTSALSSVASLLGLNNILNINPPTLLFHYEGEQTVSIETDITDHFVEDNTALQDQIAIRPVMVTTHGFIGELNNVPPPALALLQQISQKLTPLNAYVPGLSVTAINAYNTAFQAYQAAQSLANAASSVWSSLTGSKSQNLQQSMFNQLYGYLRNRTLFTVQTPWCIFKHMAIYKLRAIQGEETNVITDFEITFKEIRTAQSLLTSPIKSSIAAAQSSIAAMLGTQTAQSTALSPVQALATQ